MANLDVCWTTSFQQVSIELATRCVLQIGYFQILLILSRDLWMRDRACRVGGGWNAASVFVHFYGQQFVSCFFGIFQVFEGGTSTGMLARQRAF
jgi:hypothetical protein